MVCWNLQPIASVGRTQENLGLWLVSEWVRVSSGTEPLFSGIGCYFLANRVRITLNCRCPVIGELLGSKETLSCKHTLELSAELVTQV